MDFRKGINLRFFFFIGSIAVIIGIRIFVEQYMLSLQKEDARLIRLAGHQSMLIQKLTKASLYIEDDFEKHELNDEHVQLLKETVAEIDRHHVLLSSFIQTKHSNSEIDSMLTSVKPAIYSISNASQNMDEETDIKNMLQLIHQHDPSLSLFAENLITSYQQHADEKMERLKTMHYFFGICVFMAIVFGFAYILVPAVRGLRSGNKNLETLNDQFKVSNEKLVAAQVETKESLDKIQQLNDDLTLTEHQYRRLIETADSMIYELDEHGRFIFVNPVTERITGFSKGELYDKLFWEIVHPNHRDAATQFYFQQRKKKQEHSYYELPILTAKRKTIWIGQSTSLYFSEDSDLVKFSIISRDVTNLKMTQLKLENSEKLFRLISTNSKDLVTLYNYVEDTPIRTYVSPSVKDILGYTPEELIGKSPFDMMLSEDAVRMKETSHARVLNGQSARSEYRVYRKDGSVVWIEAFAQPFFDDAGKVIGFQTSSRDITQRIENEAKLNEAREKAEQATLAKSQFLSMMSHEIRTPLNGIIGLTNFLLEDNPSAEQLRHLRLLKFSGDNLLTIINDVLDFSKIEAHEIHLENIPFNLHNLLENALQTLRIRATDKGLPLMFSYDSKVPDIVKGDPVRLSQIINNLVSNAIKFTENGFVSVQILFSGKFDNIFSVTFSVRDTGIGIPVDKQNYIFESFTQATPDTARKFGGTGLGLSITKSLVELMQSNIVVVSELGQGTEFSFTLNLEESQLNSEAIDYSVQRDENPKSLSILLVDDNDVNLIVASNYLKKWGFQVSTAENGKEALDLIVQKAFHLVLMDLQMPEMDGYEASMKIREMDDPYFREIPILALTASAMLEDIQRLSRVGITDYVAKPFNPGELHEKITRYALEEVPGSLVSSAFSLDAYSGGDPETAKVLALRMVDNLKELQDSLNQSLVEKKEEIFRKSLHKMQTTLSILNDQRFIQTLDALKNSISIQKEIVNRLMAEVQQFTQQSNEHIVRLQEKVKTGL